MIEVMDPLLSSYARLAMVATMFGLGRSLSGWIRVGKIIMCP